MRTERGPLGPPGNTVWHFGQINEILLACGYGGRDLSCQAAAVDDQYRAGDEG